MDRPDARQDEVLNEVFDLFAALDATDEQLDFPILYASGREGWRRTTWRARRTTARRRCSTWCSSMCRRPTVDATGRSAWSPPSWRPTPILGRILTGRISSGARRPNMAVKVLRPRRHAGRDRPHDQAAGVPRPGARAGRRGARPATSSPSPACRRRPSPTRSARPESTEPLPAQPIDPPTLAMTFRINDGPLAGREGNKVTSRVIRDRLFREARGQRRAARSTESTSNDAFEVAGRGELQLGVLIETDAPRGLRARRRPPARADPQNGRRRRLLGADRGGAWSTSTRSMPASSWRSCRAARARCSTCARRAAAASASSSTRRPAA